jgi:hypothetical protein
MQHHGRIAGMPKPGVLVPRLLALLALIAAGYWYVYGRQRELIGPRSCLQPTCQRT